MSQLFYYKMFIRIRLVNLHEYIQYDYAQLSPDELVSSVLIVTDAPPFIDVKILLVSFLSLLRLTPTDSFT